MGGCFSTTSLGQSSQHVRPTIPLADWRIAVDLDATKSIRRESAHPADDCGCEQCLSWKRAVDMAFPPSIFEQLHRLGIEPQHPTDLYVTDDSKEVRGFRVMYHIAGKILSGPAPWHEHVELGTMHHYRVIQEVPTYVSLRVITAKQSFVFAPGTPAHSTSDVICLDFRLGVTRG
jgi:hypothetical protein